MHTTESPTIRTRNGKTIIKNIAPLLAPQIAAIPDEGSRLHATTVLNSAVIRISDKDTTAIEAGHTQLLHWRDFGRIATTYPGASNISVNAVLDLAEKLRDQL